MKYFVLLFFSFLWFLGCSKQATQWLGDADILPDDYRYGDLYRFSNLPKFRVLAEKCPAPQPQFKLPIQLILFGDSFTEEGRIEANHFVASHFTRKFVAENGYVSLEKNTKKVLIIETVERHFRERFADKYQHVKVNLAPPNEEKTVLQTLLDWKVPYSTERHTAVLFSSDFMLSIKELKAIFTKNIFHRIDENVTLSPNENEIVYSLDTKEGINSSFDEVSNEDVDKYVNNINSTYEFYKQQGFDEVYLSIIPNKTSIVATDLGTYNRLIERIQEHKSLKMPFIDMYKPLKKGGASLFDKGDSHWNCNGKQRWIDKVNNLLKNV